MKRNKTQKGITLVALIITIIVLLILAIVAIRAVQGDGIIAHAKNARDNYNQARIGENETIGNYTDYITDQLETNYNKIKIGDKVEYDEGYSENKTNTIDNNFKMSNLEWRVLDIESDGEVKLISTQPTKSYLELSHRQGWLDSITKLDTLCSELYANGEGVIARSLKTEDIDKLAGIVTVEDKKILNNNYGTKWRYKYDVTSGKIQASNSEDDGETWTEYKDTGHSIFIEPGKNAISSSNYQDAEGNPIIAELENKGYSYSIPSKITIKTFDNILVSDLITRGLDENDIVIEEATSYQWLSSRWTYCGPELAAYYVGRVDDKNKWMQGTDLDYSYGSLAYLPAARVRPVVILRAEMFTAKIGDTWQVNL